MIGTIVKGGGLRAVAPAIFAAGLLALPVQDAQALIVDLDPGPVGTSSPTFTFDVTGPVGGVNGGFANGSSWVFDFVFTDMKTLASPVDGTTVLSYTWSLLLGYEGSITTGAPPAPVAFIADENGTKIRDGVGSSSIVNDTIGVPNSGALYTAVFTPTTQDVFNRIQFSITLPNDPPASQLDTARLIGSANGPFVVGAPAAILPEPGTIALLGVGLAGLGFAARSRQRKVPSSSMR